MDALLTLAKSLLYPVDSLTYHAQNPIFIQEFGIFVS